MPTYNPHELRNFINIDGVRYPTSPVLTKLPRPRYGGPPPTRQQRREWLQERLDTVITEMEEMVEQVRDIITEMETLNDE